MPVPSLGKMDELIIFVWFVFVRNVLKFKGCSVPRLFDETSTGSGLEDLRHHEDTAKSLYVMEQLAV
jgi:hypothetical protein